MQLKIDLVQPKLVNDQILTINGNIAYIFFLQISKFQTSSTKFSILSHSFKQLVNLSAFQWHEQHFIEILWYLIQFFIHSLFISSPSFLADLWTLRMKPMRRRHRRQTHAIYPLTYTPEKKTGLPTIITKIKQ